VSELVVDPGQPPAGNGEEELDEQHRPPEPPEPLPGELPEWTTKSVGFLLGLVFMGLHLTLGRDGPEDAFLPTDSERREMAEPGAAMLNRSARARRLAPAGDGFAFVGLVGEFVISEQKRVADHRAGKTAAREPTVEEDLAGFGVTETRDPTRGDMRIWRPPTIEPEQP
jgi:hypothetical protein